MLVSLINCVVWFIMNELWSVCLLVPCSWGRMPVHLLFGEREKCTARPGWASKVAEHPGISAHSDAGCSAWWKFMLDPVQWYFQQQYVWVLYKSHWQYVVMWLVFYISSGSLHMYNICRFLMSAGHASQVLKNSFTCFVTLLRVTVLFTKNIYFK